LKIDKDNSWSPGPKVMAKSPDENPLKFLIDLFGISDKITGYTVLNNTQATTAPSTTPKVIAPFLDSTE
jgi:hypothetical protein